MFKILIVEDDKELRELFSTVLHENGYEAIEAKHGQMALDIIEREYIDLIITDIMMPEMDGFEFTRQLRDAGYTLPILMITASGTSLFKKEGFEAGTDDYLIKPVDLNELLWRISALLRRSQIMHEKKITLGSTTFNSNDFMVSYDQLELTLPKKEFQLLFKLVSTPNRTFTRLQLMDEIWGLDSDVDPHTLEVHIGRLRERFRDNPDFEIITVRGLGYKAVKRSTP